MKLKNYLIEYCNDVLNGDIMACQKHRWACHRFLIDLEREKYSEFEYRFDEDKAMRFLKWCTKFKHTKGILAGEHIKPMPIQVFIFANIYGWVHYKTGYRRFNRAYWQVAKKNVKSQSLALVGSYEASGLGESYSEVYIGATKTKQAKIIWNEISAQINQSEFKDRFHESYGRIKHKKSQSFIEALSKEDGKTGDGINPQCSLVDEYHLHPTSEILDNLTSASGARAQPLHFIITTAGFDLSKPCFAVEYDYISKVIDPNIDIQNDHYFIMVNELDEDDDISDEKVWEKANPIVMSYETGREYLREEHKIALDAPNKMRSFLTKNMNLWVDMKDDGYMSSKKWKEAGTEQPTKLEGLDCFVGVDLSKKIDLTSIGFVFPLPEGYYAVRSHSFMPELALAEREHKDRVPYRLWVEQGWLTVTPGEVVDYEFVEEFIERTAQENGWKIKEIDYDPYSATQFSTNMIKRGYLCVEIRQGIKTLSEPLKAFRENVYAGKVEHDHNPVLSWAVSNAIEREDAQGNIMLDKQKSKERIDPIVSVVNGFTRAMTDDGVDINDHIASQDFSF